MSKSKSKESLTPKQVEAYLQRNPAFFAERAELFALMTPPDSSDATPFHERQVETLRARQALHQTRIDSMVDAVVANQELARKMHRLACELLRRDGADVAALAELVQSRFEIDAVAIVLPSQRESLSADADYESLRARVAHLNSVCDDRVARKLAAALFPQAEVIASCAFVPLLDDDSDERSDAALRGVMVLGDADAERFQPAMGVLFLDLLGQLIGAHLAARESL